MKFHINHIINERFYLQQVAADGCEDEAGDDHPVKKTNTQFDSFRSQTGLFQHLGSSPNLTE